MKKASKLLCVFLIGSLITLAVLAPRAESSNPWYLPLLQWCANFALKLVENHNQDPDAHPYLPRGEAPYLVDSEGRAVPLIGDPDIWGRAYQVFDPEVGTVGAIYPVSYDGNIEPYVYGTARYYSGEDCTGTRYSHLYVMQKLVSSDGQDYQVGVSYLETTTHSRGSDSEGCVNEVAEGIFTELEDVPLPEPFTPPLRIEMR